MKTRDLFEKNGLPVDVVSGGSSGTYNIDTELEPAVREQVDRGGVLGDAQRVMQGKRQRRRRDAHALGGSAEGSAEAERVGNAAARVEALRDADPAEPERLRASCERDARGERSRRGVSRRNAHAERDRRSLRSG